MTGRKKNQIFGKNGTVPPLCQMEVTTLKSGIYMRL